MLAEKIGPGVQCAQLPGRSEGLDSRIEADLEGHLEGCFSSKLRSMQFRGLSAMFQAICPAAG